MHKSMLGSSKGYEDNKAGWYASALEREAREGLSEEETLE